VITKFHYLKLGLAGVLGFVGVKMLLADVFEVPVTISLAVIAGILGLSVAASLMFPKQAAAHCPVRHEALHPDDQASNRSADQISR
jgi:tellurite resistance protein TerC